jgi:hypothetical protein
MREEPECATVVASPSPSSHPRRTAPSLPFLAQVNDGDPSSALMTPRELQFTSTPSFSLRFTVEELEGSARVVDVQWTVSSSKQGANTHAFALPWQPAGTGDAVGQDDLGYGTQGPGDPSLGWRATRVFAVDAAALTLSQGKVRLRVSCLRDGAWWLWGKPWGARCPLCGWLGSVCVSVCGRACDGKGGRVLVAPLPPTARERMRSGWEGKVLGSANCCR